jgi:hypothetical protein
MLVQVLSTLQTMGVKSDPTPHSSTPPLDTQVCINLETSGQFKRTEPTSSPSSESIARHKRMDHKSTPTKSHTNTSTQPSSSKSLNDESMAE